MELWKSELLNLVSDITVCVEGEKYCVHKIVLYMSPVLKAQFEGNYIEKKEKEKIIENIERKTWENYLNYMYSTLIGVFIDIYKEKECIENKKFELERLSIEEKLDLIEMADMYMIHNLKNYIAVDLSSKIYNLLKCEEYDIVEYILKHRYYIDDIIAVSDYNTEIIYDTENNKWLSPNMDILIKYPHVLYLIFASIQGDNKPIIFMDKEKYKNIDKKYKNINYDRYGYDICLIKDLGCEIFPLKVSIKLLNSLNISCKNISNKKEFYVEFTSEILKTTIDKISGF